MTTEAEPPEGPSTVVEVSIVTNSKVFTKTTDRIYTNAQMLIDPQHTSGWIHWMG